MSHFLVVDGAVPPFHERMEGVQCDALEPPNAALFFVRDRQGISKNYVYVRLSCELAVEPTEAGPCPCWTTAYAKSLT